MFLYKSEKGHPLTLAAGTDEEIPESLNVNRDRKKTACTVSTFRCPS